MAKEPGVISAIGAVSRNGMIGLDGWLPWDIPEELAYFEAKVAGAALVIGRATYESMDVVPADSFIVTRQRGMALKPGCHAVESVEAALRSALATGKDVFVIGGASIYATAWPYLRYFYLTRIEQDFVGDSQFPGSIPLAHWKIVAESSRLLVERHSGVPVCCRFICYEQPAEKILAVPACPASSTCPESIYQGG